MMVQHNGGPHALALAKSWHYAADAPLECRLVAGADGALWRNDGQQANILVGRSGAADSA